MRTNAASGELISCFSIFIDYAHALSTTTSLEVIFLLILTFVLNCRPISDFILTSYMVHDTSFSLLSVNGPDAL